MGRKGKKSHGSTATPKVSRDQAAAGDVTSAENVIQELSDSTGNIPLAQSQSPVEDNHLDNVCEELDKLSLRSLELMEEKISAKIELEKLMREGYIELAKARYIRGKESIGTLQIPQDDQMSSLFELETNTIEKRGKDLASFDISLKDTKKNGEKSQDPLKWFGVLVPQSLRSSQKRFQESLYLAVKEANISSELECISRELETLRSLKTTLIN